MTIDGLSLDLDFGEPMPRALDLAGLRARAARRHHRRRTAAVAGVATFGLVAGLVLSRVGPGNEAAPSGPTIAVSLAAEHPPVGGAPVTLPSGEKNWTVQAWVSTDGSYCYVVTQAGSDRGGDQGSCDTSTLPDPSAAGTTIGFPMANPEPNRSGYGVEVSVVQGPATSLAFTMYAITTVVPLVHLPTLRGPSIGVALAYLPLAGHNEWGSGWLTRLVALDASGKQVAAWPGVAKKP